MKSEKYPQSCSSLQGAIRHENKSARHAIDDTSFPRYPTHSLSTGPAHPHCGAATVQKRQHSHLAHTWPHQHRISKGMQAYSVLANVQKSDPTHELATTNSCAGMLYGYGVDCHYPTNHLKRLAGTRAAISANDGRWSSRRRLKPSRSM